MDKEQLISFANSFPDEHDEFEISLQLTTDEFSVFENGVFAEDMDSKWHIFVLDDVLYFVRSWTGFCIYKIFYSKIEDSISIGKIEVNRNPNQYNSTDIEYDKATLLQLIEVYLEKEDLYVDPRFESKLIKELILQIDPDNNYKKSIGSQHYGLTLMIYESVIQNLGKDYIIYGLDELKNNAKDINKNDDLISLFIHNRNNKKDSRTYYFDKDLTKLLGIISNDGELRIKV